MFRDEGVVLVGSELDDDEEEEDEGNLETGSLGFILFQESLWLLLILLLR